ncbi:hypothetical protein V5799_021897, partial [Amblyomma americanum]
VLAAAVRRKVQYAVGASDFLYGVDDDVVLTWSAAQALMGRNNVPQEALEDLRVERVPIAGCFQDPTTRALDDLDYGQSGGFF